MLLGISMRPASWIGAATTFLLGRRRPLVVGFALTDVCNLHCVHCRVANVRRRQMPLDDVRARLADLYRRGARILYFEGGEPYLWRDGPRRLADAVGLARRLGYLRVHVYTNGTRPLDARPDFHWVSIDGPPEVHRAIRGAPVDATLAHLRELDGPAAVICTLNTRNVGALAETLRFVEEALPGRRVMFYFHTPYYGVDDLLLDRGRRIEAAEEIVGLKRRGAPVLNSVPGIRAAASGAFRRPLAYTAVVDETGEYPCCRAVGSPEVCAHCGYAACAEMELVRRLRPGAVREAVRFT
jgi:MoaA/NifB/PqqE/SkfB family radical SAM enzyme